MESTNPLNLAVSLASRATIARECGVTVPAVRKWQKAGRLPRSEHVGITRHARNISRAVQGTVSEVELLEWSRSGWLGRT